MLLENVFQGKYSIPILEVIVSTAEGCGITEIARKLGISKSVVFRSINYLENENILISFARGKSKVYRLNENNYFVKKLVRGIFEIEDQSLSKIRFLIVERFKKVEALSLVLYGSFLTPGFDFKSDIDLMLIVKNKKEAESKVTKITKYFYDMGLTLFVDIVELSEFRKLHRIREPLVLGLVKNGVVLQGKHPMELI